MTAPTFDRETILRVVRNWPISEQVVLAPMERVVKQRAKENPLVITVHIPEDAPPDEEERVMADHEGQFPGVPVVVRRYRRSAKRNTRQPEDSH